MDLQQRQMKWATRLEEVLADFDALQLFQSWMGVDDDSSEHPLRLHFAIVAYREMLARNDPRAPQLAREIYNKFLRPKSGLCAFIEPNIRERVAQRLRHMAGTSTAADLFDECIAPLETFLRKQHALFVSSHEFLDKFNTVLSLDEQPCCSSSNQRTPARRSRKHEAQERAPPLTANMLMRSQKEREAMVPAGAASQRLFKPVSKLPYVGQAQPSKNDSAVSSAFSSEANQRTDGSYSLRMMRDEQKRCNPPPPLAATFPRLEQPGQALRECAQQAASQFRHDTPEGRQHFAELLQRKLHVLQLRHRQDESIKEEIERINLARQKGGKQSTRELIGQSAGNALLTLEESLGVDADEELENYYRKMAADSSSANSAQQSPLVPLSRRTRRRSRGHGSCSPSERAPHLDWASVVVPPFGGAAMSQSCCSANPSTSAGFSLAPSYFGHYPLLESAERAFLPLPPSQAQQQQHHPFGISPFQSAPFNQPKSVVGMTQPACTSANAVTAAFSQSMHTTAANPVLLPQPKPQPPPTPFAAPKSQSHTVAYCDNDGDTSGIGSLSSATHSGTSAPGTTEKQRAAVFRKARELSSGGGTAERHQTGTGTSSIPRQKKGQQPEQQQQQSGANSLPRPRAALPQQPSLLQQQQQQSPTNAKMTIGYRDSSGDGVPIVAHIAHKPLTFREFRRILSISSKDCRQFFFKVACEDGTAPYQLLLVNDDHALLPLFEGKITAECRAPLSDSD